LGDVADEAWRSLTRAAATVDVSARRFYRDKRAKLWHNVNYMKNQLHISPQCVVLLIGVVVFGCTADPWPEPDEADESGPKAPAPDSDADADADDNADSRGSDYGEESAADEESDEENTASLDSAMDADIDTDSSPLSPEATDSEEERDGDLASDTSCISDAEVDTDKGDNPADSDGGIYTTDSIDWSGPDAGEWDDGGDDTSGHASV
jgi:hypothetical protein